MPDLDARLDLAKSLFGGSASQSTNTIKGTVMADSSSGTVSVKIGEVEYDDDGNIIVPEADLITTIPIIGSASTGDEVMVVTQDGTPTAIAAPGWGDEIAAGVEKTQYITFVQGPSVDAGLHIHENPASYNTDGDLHLTSGGLEIKDTGTKLASFGATQVELGANSTTSEVVFCNGAGTIQGQQITPYKVLDLRSDNMNMYGERRACVYSSGKENENNEGVVAITAGAYKNAHIELIGQYAMVPGEPANLSGISLGADLLYIYNNTYGININGDYGTNGQVLTSQGAGSPPIWAAVPSTSLAWTQITTAANQTAKTIDLSGYSEVMVVADVTRNGVLHTFANSFPIQAFGNSAHEYKIGGYVGTSGTSGGAWCSMSLTSFAGANACINGTSFINSTDWTVYAR